VRARAGLVVLVVLFAALFALAELAAVSNLIALPQVYDALGVPEAVPWWLLVLGVAIPPAAFVVALLLGRRRPAGDRALLLLVGLAAAHALALSSVALAPYLLPAA